MDQNSEINGKYFIRNEFLIPAREFSGQFLREGINIYEVLRIYRGAPLFMEDHLDRFFNSLQGSGMEYSFASGFLKEKIHRLIVANELSTGNIKIVYHFPGLGEAYLILYPVFFYYPSEDQYKNGVPCTFLEEMRKDPALKSWKPLLKDKIKRIRETKNVYEVILVNDEGIVTEGSQSNLFFIENNRVVTAKKEKVLSGITRKYVFQICRSSGIEIIESDIMKRDISVFQSAFISGTSPKVLPISHIDGVKFNPKHPLLSLIIKEYNKIMEGQV